MKKSDSSIVMPHEILGEYTTSGYRFYPNLDIAYGMYQCGYSSVTPADFFQFGVNMMENRICTQGG